MDLNRDDERRALLATLEQAGLGETLDRAIERHLTRLIGGFSSWLRILDIDHPEAAAGHEAFHDRIAWLAEHGDYTRAEFDEEEPDDARELLLALARRVGRGEIDLDRAAVLGRDWFAARREEPSDFDWMELSQGLSEVADPGPEHVHLAEVLDCVGRAAGCLPPELTYGSLVNVSNRRVRRLHERGDPRGAVAECLRLAGRLLAAGEATLACQALLMAGDGCRSPAADRPEPERLGEALGHYNDALELAERSALEPTLRAEALYEVGNVLYRRGSWAEAVEVLGRCLDLLRGLDPPGPAEAIDRALIRLGQAQGKAGDVRASAATLEAALATARDPTERVGLLQDLALSLSHFDGRRAEGIAARALAERESLQAGGQDAPEATSAGGLPALHGLVRMRAGDFQAARDALEAAIAEADAAGDEANLGRWLGNLGQVLTFLGKRNEARRTLRRAIEIHQRHEDHSAAGTAALNLGHILADLGDLAGAATVWGEAFAQFHKAGQPAQMGIGALALARLHHARGEPARADACLVYAESRTRGLPRIGAYVERIRGTFAEDRGDRETAEATYTRAAELAREAHETLAEAEALLARGRVRERLGRDDQAEDDYRHALAIQDEARSRLRASVDRMGLQGRPQYAHTPLIRLLARRGDRPGARAEAFALAERDRSRTLAELLGRRPLRTPTTLPADLARREAELLRALLDLEESGEAGSGPAREHARLAAELAATWDAIAAVDDACREYVALRRGTSVDARAVAALLAIPTPDRGGPP